MPHLLGLRVRNYRALADVKIGRTRSTDRAKPLERLSCFIGPNGSGKSTLLDALGFIADCLTEGVEAACDKPQRGGFDRLRTQGATGPIELQLFYREEPSERPIRYRFSIDVRDGVPAVVDEELLQPRGSNRRGKLYPFLRLSDGQGQVWAGEKVEGEEGAERVPIALSDRGTLGITTLGNLREHPRIVGLRRYVESWYLSYFIPDAARRLPPAGAHRHLDREGSNVGNVLQYLERKSPERCERLLKSIAEAIPGLQRIRTERSPDARLLLRFNEQGYQDPFFQQSMSDGTLKMFAYLLLLEDPEPRPFIGIEEPENGLYHQLLERLARQLGRHAIEGREGQTQILATTHSPYFVDALKPEQVWILRRDPKGRTKATRAADIPEVRALAEEGIPLGSLWYSRHFEPTE